MRPLRWLIPALVLAALTWAAPGAEAQRAQPRIIGGSDVAISAYPFQVRLRIVIGGSTFLCGGAIRDSTHVITAGHCVTTGSKQHTPVSAASVTVFYGSDTQSQQSSVGVSAVLVPAQYTVGPTSDDAYDVALLTLSSAVDLSGPNAKAVPIAAPSQPKAAGTALVTGWGRTTEGGSTSQTLKGVRVPLRSDSECSNRYGTVGVAPDYLYYDSTRAVCAGGGTAASGNPDTCQGDSGGPLVVDLDSSAATDFVLMGVTSFGSGCGRQDTAAVYTWTQGTGIETFLSAASYQSPTAPTSGDFTSGTPGAITRTQPPTVGASPSPAPFVAPLPAPAPVPAVRDTTRPAARVSKLSCTKKRKCSFRIAASDKGGTVRKLSATVTRKVRTCKRRGDVRVCSTTTRKKTLKPKRISGGFTFSASLAKATYKLSSVATDAAGNRSKAISRTFRVR